jgi:hypothetical protein
MKVSLGNFIAERDQMFNMFAKNATKLVKAIRNVRKGNFRQAARDLGCLPSKRLSTHKSVANNWLELQYGWLPLLSDIYEASLIAEAAFAEKRERPPINKVVSVVKTTGSDVFTPSNPTTARISREYMCFTRGTIKYTVDVEAAAFLGSIGLTNPLSIAWEVMPFSFVVDWALPVGRALENLDATLGCNFVSGTTSAQLHSIMRYALGPETGNAGNLRYEWQHITAQGRWFRYLRTAHSGFPSVSLPQPKNPFSAAHAKNALALLAQAFR